MKYAAPKTRCAFALVISGILAVGPVMAASPFWPVASKHDKDDQWEKGDKGHKGDKGDKGHKGDKDDKWEKGHKGGKGDRDARHHFEDRHYVVVHEYYTEHYRGGRCPPGLKKKHNGCMPPGQAKKWMIGRPLPREVIYYEVPQPLVVQIGPPPSGYRYVRVASDILLITIGTSIVIDVIQDFGR